MKQICDEAVKLLESGESFVQATILKSSGSIPRGAGACMLVRSDGSIKGTVGGGAIEAGIIRAARRVFDEKRSQVIDVVLDGKDAVAVGMICGGSATVLVDYIDAENPGNLDFFKTLGHALRKGAQIVTAPSSAARSQCLLLRDGSLRGTDGFDPDILHALQNGRNALTELPGVYLHQAGADGAAYIFGAGHCGEKLAPVLSSVGFSIIVIDDRAEFANSSRFLHADEILVPESMALVFDDIEFNADSYIIIVTRGHVFDELVLRCALKTRAGYIGMIGSRTKRDAIYGKLLADGYTQEDLDRVYSPIGIQIGDETPEEIAVSITAQLIKVRAERRRDVR